MEMEYNQLPWKFREVQYIISRYILAKKEEVKQHNSNKKNPQNSNLCKNFTVVWLKSIAMGSKSWQSTP